MREFLLIVLCLNGSIALSQQTIHSIANGNATNPLIWDCTCFPSTNDDIVVDHDVIMNTDWIVNNGGSITVSSGASLIEDSQHRTILIDQSGSQYLNVGTTELTNISLTNGATLTNNGALSLDTGLYICPTCVFSNTASVYDLDSLLNEGQLVNSGNITGGDMWTLGQVTNNGAITADSLLNSGTFNMNNGMVDVLDFANTNEFTIGLNSYMIVDNNFWNTGNFTVSSGRDLRIGNDFWNGDTLGGIANIFNDGLIEVTNDFWNADSMSGSGNFCVGASTTNTGNVVGTLDFCDNSGTSGFDLNTGTIAGTVTFCATSCAVHVATNARIEILVYPNPVTNRLNITGAPYGASFTITDLSGRRMMHGTYQGSIAMDKIADGTYILQIHTELGTGITRFMKH